MAWLKEDHGATFSHRGVHVNRLARITTLTSVMPCGVHLDLWRRCHEFGEPGQTVLRGILALIAGLLVCLATSAALAQTATYNVTGSFSAPATGTFSGSYVVNTGSNTIVSASMQVTPGKADDGTTDVPGNTYTYAGFELNELFTFATAVPANGLRGGYLQVVGTKAAPGPAIFTIRDTSCINANCSGISNASSVNRYGTGTVALAPAPAPVPTLSEWAMILLGLMLAGGAALYIQRRQMLA